MITLHDAYVLLLACLAYGEQDTCARAVDAARSNPELSRFVQTIEAAPVHRIPAGARP